MKIAITIVLAILLGYVVFRLVNNFMCGICALIMAVKARKDGIPLESFKDDDVKEGIFKRYEKVFNVCNRLTPVVQTAATIGAVAIQIRLIWF